MCEHVCVCGYVQGPQQSWLTNKLFSTPQVTVTRDKHNIETCHQQVTDRLVSGGWTEHWTQHATWKMRGEVVMTEGPE